MTDETYFSIDVEADGPAPGINSMLSCGLAAFQQGQLVGTFSRNLQVLPDAVQNADTMAWWATQSEAWEACRRNPVDPAQAMQEAAEFCEQYPERRVAVGWPIAFDFSYLSWYWWRFVGRNPLGFAGLDLRSYLAGVLNIPRYYQLPESEINKLAKNRLPPYLQKHNALDDAIEQGILWVAAQEYVDKVGLAR